MKGVTVPAGLLLIVLIATELSFYMQCSIDVDERLTKEKFMALDSPCNEHQHIYSELINCRDLRKSLDPRTAWVQTGRCMASKHNFFAIWGWLEFLLFGAVVVTMCYLFYLYKRKTAKYTRKLDKKHLFYSNDNLPNGMVIQRLN